MGRSVAETKAVMKTVDKPNCGRANQASAAARAFSRLVLMAAKPI
jgi:hypothetical protein